MYPIIRYYINTRRDEWEEEEYFLVEQLSTVLLNKYNDLLTSRRCYTKDPKDVKLLDLVGVAQKLVDWSNKSSENSNRSEKCSTFSKKV